MPLRFQSAILFTIMLLALLHGLIFEVEPHAPIRQIPAGTSPQQHREHQVAAESKWFSESADGGNIAMHFTGFESDSTLLSRLIGQFYFPAVYELYPHRVIIGTGNQIINSAADVQAADTLQNDSWLAQHDVHAVLTIYRGGDGTLHFDTRKLH